MVEPRRQEHRAFSKLSGRVLYVGITYDGPQWNSRTFTNHWYFQRVRHIHLRLESTDTDRNELLELLSQLPHLEKVELIACDPRPATQSIIQQTITEVQTHLPAVDVTITE